MVIGSGITYTVKEIYSVPEDFLNSVTKFNFEEFIFPYQNSE